VRKMQVLQWRRTTSPSCLLQNERHIFSTFRHACSCALLTAAVTDAGLYNACRIICVASSASAVYHVQEYRQPTPIVQ
jgi:hypothetical protein